MKFSQKQFESWRFWKTQFLSRPSWKYITANAKLMPFASIIPNNQRTNPWNFHKKILRIGYFENRPFWIFFFKKKIFFGLIPMKISQKLCDRMSRTQFWCFLLFPANSLLCVIIPYTVYLTFKLVAVY